MRPYRQPWLGDPGQPEFFRVLLRVRPLVPAKETRRVMSPIYTSYSYYLCRPWEGPLLSEHRTGGRLPKYDPMCLPVYPVNPRCNAHNRAVMQQRARNRPWDGSDRA